MLYNCWLKDHVQTAENCQILYAKFCILFKNIPRKITTNFVSTLVLSLALERFIYDKAIQNHFYILQSHSIGCSLASHNTKDPIAMIKRLIAKSSNKLLTVFHQRNFEIVFRHS